MMTLNRLVSTALLALATAAMAAPQYEADVIVTNAAITHGEYLTVNGEQRTWVTNETVNGIIITNTIPAAAANLWKAIAKYPFSNFVYSVPLTNGVRLFAQAGAALDVSLSNQWGLIVQRTNSVATAHPVRVPLTAEISETHRTNVATWVMDGLNRFSALPLDSGLLTNLAFAKIDRKADILTNLIAGANITITRAGNTATIAASGGGGGGGIDGTNDILFASIFNAGTINSSTASNLVILGDFEPTNGFYFAAAAENMSNLIWATFTPLSVTNSFAPASRTNRVEGLAETLAAGNDAGDQAATGFSRLAIGGAPGTNDSRLTIRNWEGLPWLDFTSEEDLGNRTYGDPNFQDVVTFAAGIVAANKVETNAALDRLILNDGGALTNLQFAGIDRKDDILTNLVAGANVTITRTGNTATIAASGGGGGGATNAYIGWLGSAADIRAPSTAMPSAPDGLRIPLARTTDFCEFRTFLPPGWRTNGTVTVRLLVPNTSTAPGTLRLSALGWKTSDVGVPSKPDYTASTNVSWAGNGVLSNIIHAVVSPAIFTNTAAGDELWLMLEYVAGNTGEVSYVRIDY